MNKQSAVERAIFRGFVDRIMKAVDDDEVSELTNTSLWRTGPGKQDRPARSAYARQDPSRDLVDNVVGKVAV